MKNLINKYYTQYSNTDREYSSSFEKIEKKKKSWK